MSFDITKIERSEDLFQIEKLKTNKKGTLYFTFIFLLLSLITIFSNRDTIYITSLASLAIALSSLIFIFHKYKIIISLKEGNILIEKKFILTRKTVFPITEIIDYKIKEGEAGILLIIVRGVNAHFFIKPEKKYTIFRGSKTEEVEEILKTIKKFVSRETI